MENRIFYERKLPHWHLPASKFNLTYRLVDSIPIPVMQQLKRDLARKKITREEHFEQYEIYLEKKSNGPYWLHDERIAKLIIDSLLFNDQIEYDLNCATVMGNHVHVVLETFQKSQPLEKILQNHKKFTARQSNRILNRSEHFWEEETYDSVIRNENHFWNCVNYSINNPVKSGLVKKWKDWKFTYVKPSLLKFLKE